MKPILSTGASEHFDWLRFQFNLQIEQGIPLLSKWLIFNRFKFVASKVIRLGPAFLLTRWAESSSCCTATD